MIINKSYYTLENTHEGANMHAHSGDNCLEFFSKAGSLFEKRESFYDIENELDIIDLYKKAFEIDVETSMKLMFWLRDCRGGAGNRSGFRKVLKWMGEKYPSFIEMNIKQIPLYGRWDDLRSLYGTHIEKKAAEVWGNAIKERNVLAAKWCDRSDRPVRKYLGLKIGAFRRLLSSIRKEHIVEYNMCSGKWNDINYEHVPSLAMARYTNAFKKNDGIRFEQYKESLIKGDVKINASALFPHDCVRTVMNGDGAIANAQFDSLPNFMEDNKELIMVISDTSASMLNKISGSIQSIHVSIGMALYCSGKMPKESPFYKRFIGFSSEGHFKDWRKMSFYEAVRSRKIFDGAVGTTRVDKALDTILSMAKKVNIPQRLMPTTLLIISDMQFHCGVDGPGTEVEKSLKEWETAGYNKPKVVYWNTAGYIGSQANVFDYNVGLISGFSPAILKAVFGGEDFSPRAVMMRALEKYEIILP